MDIKIQKAELSQIKNLQKFMHLLMEFEHKFDKKTLVKWATSKDCEDYFKKRIKGRNSIALVAVYDGELIGYLTGEVRKGDAWRKFKIYGELADIFVSEKYRRKNVGGMLAQEFFRWVKKKGAGAISVIAYAENEKAHGFYKKNGFEDLEVTFEKVL